MTDVRALLVAAPNNDLNDIAPFDIPVTFVHTELPWLMTIKNFMFKEYNVSSDQDTTDIKYSCTGIASHCKNKPA